MKNSEIHNNLPQKDVRDFLGRGLLEADKMQNENKKEIIPYDNEREDILEWSIRDAEKQIEYLQKHIQRNRQVLAIEQLIKSSGWKEHDVSNETNKDIKDGWMSFIGTDAEYNHLIKIIKKTNT